MLVSVVIPTYNCSKYIASTIESVIAQTISDWEIQIVDDCSTDNTYDVLKPYLERYPFIHYSRLPQKGGAAVARTEAIKRSRGKYIAFLDSDDLWLPDKLKIQISYMEKNNLPFTCTAYKQIDAKGNDLHTILTPPSKINYTKCIVLGNPIANLTAVYNQEALGKFEVPTIDKRNDFALWLQILKKTQYCIGLKDVLSVYRCGRIGSISHNKLKQIKYHWILYHDIEKHNVILCAILILFCIFVKITRTGVKKRKEVPPV